MNLTELARKLKITTKELKEKLPELGFDIGMRAIQIPDEQAKKVIEAWQIMEKEEEKKRYLEKLKERIIKKEVVEERKITLPKVIAVHQLAERLNLPVTKVIQQLIKNGVLATINDNLDFEIAAIISEQLGFKVEQETEEMKEKEKEIQIKEKLEKLLKEEDKKLLKPKPPVVVVMGHVDHGKCVAPETLIPLADGKILSAQEIWEKHKIRGKVRKYKNKGYIVEVKNGPKVFSFNGKGIVKKQISHLWKLKSSTLVRIKLASGDEIAVTPEHPFYVFTSKGEIEQKRADLIDKESFIVVPQKLELFVSDSIIKRRIIEKLETLNNFVVFLNNKKGIDFLKKLQLANKQELYRKNLLSTNFSAGLQKGMFRARDFVKIGRYLKFSLEELYNIIDSFKNTTEKWRAGHTSNKIKLFQMPRDLEKLGWIIGCLVGDGQTQNGILHNSNQKIQNVFQNYIEKIFNVTTKLIKTKTSYKIVNSGYKTFTRFLTDILDFPRYKKSGNIKFPRVFYGSLPFIKGFIAGWFDTDGYVSPFNHSIEITSKSKDLVKQIAILLLGFGIHSTIVSVPSKRNYFTLRIANNPYLERFLNEFPVKHEEKKERIQIAKTKSSVSRIFDLTPLSGQSLYSFYIDEHLFPYFNQYRKYKHLSRHFLQKLLERENKISFPKIFSKPTVKNLINPGEISLVKVISKKQIKNKNLFVFDFTIPKTHNFVAERIFVHNTSLLDKIRETNVVSQEAGAITQKIGAYEVEKKGKKITFIDTPGHEAFKMMRARGGQVADIAILVVAADDGVQEQTIESLKIIQKENLPFIVAINKIDKPEADPEKIKKQLSELNLTPEEWGGKTICSQVSSKTGQGVDGLLDLILLVAEMEKEKLMANPNRLAIGTIIEAHLDKGEGPVATVIIHAGKLKIGDSFMVGETYGKVKLLKNWLNEKIKEALPGTPVQIIGLKTLPVVGDILEVKTEKEIKEIRKKIKKIYFRPKEILVKEEKEEIKSINLIIKADVVGSLEALIEAMKKLETEAAKGEPRSPEREIKIKIIKRGLGTINEIDVLEAEKNQALILGFNVEILIEAKKIAQEKDVRIILSQIIYDLIEEVKKELTKVSGPKIKETLIGKVKILALFRKEERFSIVGGKILEGKIKPETKIRLWRNNEIIGEGKLTELQINKIEVKEAAEGEECGIKYKGSEEIKIGDVLEVYEEKMM